jgi:hypothetical protein
LFNVRGADGRFQGAALRPFTFSISNPAVTNTMSDIIRIQDLSAAEIRAALDEVDEEKRRAVTVFLAQIGGLENARLAIQMLEQLESAA